MNQMMVPPGGYVIAYDANGNKVMEASAAQVNGYLQNRGGSLQTAGQAVQAVSSAMQISTLRELRRDVREARAQHSKAVDELIKYQNEKDAVLAAKLAKVLTTQKDLDREQSRMLGNAIDQAWIQIAGSGMQLVGSLQGGGMGGMGGGMGGMGGMGGGIDGTTAVLGLGLGALLVEAFDDDDDKKNKD